MAKIVYNEYYGELTYALQATIRKHNVTRSDYDHLKNHYGEGNYAAIQAGIKQHSTNGLFHLTDFKKAVAAGVE